MNSCRLLLLFYFVLAVFAATINKDVLRIIDITNSIVSVITDIKIIGLHEEYIIAYPEHIGKNLAYLQIVHGKEEIIPTNPVTNGNYTFLTIETSAQNLNLKITAMFTNVLEPKPPMISQNEAQYMKYMDNIFFTSPYRTINQKTIIKLASSRVLSYTTDIEPYSLKGDMLTYGVYKDIPEYEVRLYDYSIYN